MSAKDRAAAQLAIDAANAFAADRARRAAGVPVGEDPAHERAKGLAVDSEHRARDAGLSEAEIDAIRRTARRQSTATEG